MITKRIKLIVLIILISFSYSCMVQDMIHVDEIYSKKRGKIYGLVKNNNDWIEFDRTKPVKLKLEVIEGYVTGKGGELEFVSIPVRDVKLLWIKKVGIVETSLNLVSAVGFPFTVYGYWPLFLPVGIIALLSAI